MDHTPPIPLKFGKKTYAYSAISKPNKLIIFIHGFNGNSTTTWGEFTFLMQTDPDLADTDIIFYGYDSTKEQANNNAIRFYKLLKSINDEGLDKHTSYNRKFGLIKYTNILLVAHSLGSIIIRRSLLHAKSENKVWLSKCKMIMFAPAHKGSRVQNTTLMVVPKWMKVILGFGYFSRPIIEDLMPNSQTIRNLINDTMAYISRNDGDFTIAHKVIWAANELIVHNETFCSDPVAEIKEHKNHKTVCKPLIPDYADPFDIVKNAL
jgi:hypothetical protein